MVGVVFVRLGFVLHFGYTSAIYFRLDQAWLAKWLPQAAIADYWMLCQPQRCHLLRFWWNCVSFLLHDHVLCVFLTCCPSDCGICISRLLAESRVCAVAPPHFTHISACIYTCLCICTRYAVTHRTHVHTELVRWHHEQTTALKARIQQLHDECDEQHVCLSPSIPQQCSTSSLQL